jgi:hypothetical protein
MTPSPIVILFLAANPSDTTRLRLGDEVRAIDQALRQAAYRDQFDLRQHWAVRMTDLQELLLRHQPHIVHFSGHGSPEGRLLFEDPSGRALAARPDALSRLFAILTDNVRCVVLNACYSEPQAQAIAAHIDCVVGMPAEIADAASIGFAASFYRALAYGRDVETAFELGRLEVDLEELDQPDKPKLLAQRQDPSRMFLVGSGPSPEPGVEAPLVLSTSPPDGMTNVRRDLMSVAIQFDRPMQPRGCSLSQSGWFGLQDALCHYDPGSYTFTVTRDNPGLLPAHRTIEFTINPGTETEGGFVDQMGNRAATTRFRFTTGDHPTVWLDPDERASLERQLAEQRENLRLIEERKAMFVQETDIPPQLIKDERHTRQRIADLEQRLGIAA